MKEKSQIEKKAEEKQITLLSTALSEASVRENEQGVPFLFYNWNKYVHRNNPEQIISRDDYMKLYEEEQKLYKGVHNREIRTLFNIDQTTLPYVDKEQCSGKRIYGS